MRYKLEKYKGQSTRFACPKCGRNRSFTRYIDEESQEYISPLVGICNRLVKCAYHLTPKMYFQENPWLKSEFNNEGFPKILPKIPPKFLSKKEVIPINTIDVEIMFKTYDNKSRFIEFLLSKFSEKDVEKTKIEYCLGGDKNGRVIFWQIDEMLRLRTGKMMNYNALSGKRLKVRQGSLPSLSWVHAELKRVGKLDKNWTLTQCLFGLHLTSIYKDKPVHIVESEKTAVIMSIILPHYLWLATGGLCNLSVEKIWPIRGRDIRLYPDLGCYDKWLIKAKEISLKTGCRIAVDATLENNNEKCNLKDGDDIVDWFRV